MSKKPFNVKEYLAKQKTAPKEVVAPILSEKDKEPIQTTTLTPKTPQKAKKGTKKDHQKTQTILDNPPKTYSTPPVKKPNTYLQFVSWISLPEGERTPTNQKEFAKKYKVTEDTLSLWKKRKGFWDDVRGNVKSHWKEKLGLAVQALFTGLITGRKASEFLAFVQYIDGFNPSLRVDDVTPPERKLTQEQRTAMLDTLAKVGLKNLVDAYDTDDDEV